MAEQVARSAYDIVIRRTPTGWCAGIPELGIREEAADAGAALGAAMDAERVARESLAVAGTPPPPPGPLAPFPWLGDAAGRVFALAGRVVAAYAVALMVTAILVVMAAPYLRARAEQYVGSGKAGEDVGRLLARLGVSACTEKR